ncbi:ABC transporter substrate-binding protein [Hymenobacter sp. BT186]|uniref:ABC transporter substrate-binding protein n=1 Tax=Hymenobacter telluris TaxID=2816474 RepID=A0A939EYJ7_9BACT|nr:ABC transporter substrate-binding protein [Hymenobacter telluris]MBO0359537.1 ABC transporter substrate-binding protein [Hymenobacter telluris]MBW3375563.1 ABC transporter substrate-binding protein [Hymenobacter norwichensis]
MKKIFYATLLLASVACNRFRNEETASTTPQPERIVSVSKQLTEMIFALGAENRLVGVDLSSTYPAAAKKLPTVGYHRLLNAEGIISLKPTVVYSDGNVAPAAVITQVQKVGIPIKEFTPSKTIPETCQLLQQLGDEFKQRPLADKLAQQLTADMAQAAANAKQYPDHPKVVIIHYGLQKNIYLAMGQQSIGTQMVAWAGGVNSLNAAEGMKPISPELIAEAQPDVILATDFGYDRQGGLEKFKQLPGVALTPAAKNNRIYRVEEHDMVYLGPRTGQNVLMLQKLIHQQPAR